MQHTYYYILTLRPHAPTQRHELSCTNELSVRHPPRLPSTWCLAEGYTVYTMMRSSPANESERETVDEREREEGHTRGNGAQRIGARCSRERAFLPSKIVFLSPPPSHGCHTPFCLILSFSISLLEQLRCQWVEEEASRRLCSLSRALSPSRAQQLPSHPSARACVKLASWTHKVISL